MYANLTAFKAAVFSCNPPYDAASLNEIEIAWKIYQGAQQAHLNLLVLGRMVAENTELTAGIDDLMRTNLLKMNERQAGGSIMYTEKWSLLVNDAFLIGGIHSFTEFHLASPRERRNIRCSVGDFAGQLTVTGRELVALREFGYSVRKLPLGEVFVCTDHKAAARADFATYVKKVLIYTEREDESIKLCDFTVHK
ncbi:hypothetical protein [Burkholderia sp. LMU1-1-1.1]|jgi:hypothetical protein|uniref:hypothetical protein n=1 Tax=Burkholderia sp. LMU1-1-1.1 TaxID=3135266 RepID=UPI0034198C16